MRVPFLGLVALALVATGTLPSCGADGGGEGPPPPDSGSGLPHDAGSDGASDTDTECEFYPRPQCGPNRVPYRPDVGTGCPPPWECRDCPPESEVTRRCPEGKSLQPDRWGCISNESECACTISRPPDCPRGQVPQRVGQGDDWCYTGACTPADCPPVPTPECSLYEEPEVDANGCRTGRCVPVPCEPVETPSCPVGERQRRLPSGCPTEGCEPEPPPCPPVPIPDCPEGTVPEVTYPEARHGGCFTGNCVQGACVSSCRDNRMCASSDACLLYDDACSACIPRKCETQWDCRRFGRADCVAGRCVLRIECTCTRNEECGVGLECDDPVCGRCVEPCACHDDAQCPDGAYCHDCQCLPGCRTDGDCPERGEGCHPVTRECLPCVCASDGECGADQWCNGCFCQEGCRSAEDCPPWQICDLRTHACVPEVQCERNRTCGEGRICVDGHCLDDPGTCAPLGLDDTCVPVFDTCACNYTCRRRSAEPLPDCAQECPDRASLERPMCLCTEDGCDVGTCGGPQVAECPAVYHCSRRDPGNPVAVGVCREGRPEARRLCRVDGDCVPEDCCHPTYCVRRDDAACESPVTCDEADACYPPLAGCRCRDGVCVGDYDVEACL